MIEGLIRDVPDFPKEGILFKDITPLLQSPAGLRASIDGLVEAVDPASYDAVCGGLTTLRGSAGDFTAATDLCLADDHTGSAVDYALTPQPGEGAWFLVRGSGGAAPRTYDSLSPTQLGARDAEIDASSLSCP